MKRYRVVVGENAERELAEAFVWIEERAPGRAKKWFRGLLEAITGLETMPRRCPLDPAGRFFGVETRCLLYGDSRNAYRILYTIVRDEVHILHIRHGRRRTIGPKKQP